MQQQKFIQAVREAETTLYHVAMSILRNDADSADAVQEALLKAFEKLDTLKEEKYFKTWLTRILIHECYQIQRKKKRLVPYEEYVEREPGNEDKLYTDLYTAIKDLPEDLRIAVTLFYIEGFSIAEIVQMLGIKENTVKTRLYRGRNQLRKSLGDKEEALC